MGGELTLESSPEKGSRFWFTIPLVVGTPFKETDVSSHSVLLSAKRILLTEDNQINQMVAKGLLESMGHSVTTVETGQAALRILEESRFDAFLIDINLPDMEGTELCEQLEQILCAENHSVQAKLLHRMKGSATSLGLTMLSDFCARMEISTRDLPLQPAEQTQLKGISDASNQVLRAKFPN